MVDAWLAGCEAPASLAYLIPHSHKYKHGLNLEEYDVNISPVSRQKRENIYISLSVIGCGDIVKMPSRSASRAEAFQRACTLAGEGKAKGEIVDFLISTYLLGHGEAYSLARAAIYHAKDPSGSDKRRWDQEEGVMKEEVKE